MINRNNKIKEILQLHYDHLKQLLDDSSPMKPGETTTLNVNYIVGRDIAQLNTNFRGMLPNLTGIISCITHKNGGYELWVKRELFEQYLASLSNSKSEPAYQTVVMTHHDHKLFSKQPELSKITKNEIETSPQTPADPMSEESANEDELIIDDSENGDLERESSSHTIVYQAPPEPKFLGRLVIDDPEVGDYSDWPSPKI